MIESERKKLATVIYYPEEKINFIQEQGSQKKWRVGIELQFFVWFRYVNDMF